MPAASDGAGRQAPREWAKVYGDAMASHGLRHGDTIRIVRDLAPSEDDIVFAEIQGIGRISRKLSVIGGVHGLIGDLGIKPVVVSDPSIAFYFGVVISKLEDRSDPPDHSDNC